MDIKITKAGLEALKKELSALVDVKRLKIVDRLSNARSQGDLSENSDYQSAREELEFLDGRIDELEELLNQAVLITETHTKGNNHVVKLGSRVSVNIKGKKEEFTVVGEWEADPKEKKISHESPLGKALLGKKVGEMVEVEAPAGKIKYKVLEIG